MPARDRGVALHEAAHAVLMLATGCSVRIVSIVPAGDMLGHAQVDLGSGASRAGTGPALTAWHAAVALVVATAHAIAGPVADEISARRSDGRREGEDTADMAEELFGAPSRLWLPVLRRAVEVYLRANWTKVAIVAAALLERGTLTNADLRALIGEIPRLDLQTTINNIEHHAARARSRMAS